MRKSRQKIARAEHLDNMTDDDAELSSQDEVDRAEESKKKLLKLFQDDDEDDL